MPVLPLGHHTPTHNEEDQNEEVDCCEDYQQEGRRSDTCREREAEASLKQRVDKLLTMLDV